MEQLVFSGVSDAQEVTEIGFRTDLHYRLHMIERLAKEILPWRNRSAAAKMMLGASGTSGMAALYLASGYGTGWFLLAGAITVIAGSLAARFADRGGVGGFWMPYEAQILPDLKRFWNEHGHRIKELADRVWVFNQAAWKFQVKDCPLRGMPERYAAIIDHLRARREKLQSECDEMIELYDIVLEPYWERERQNDAVRTEEMKRLRAFREEERRRTGQPTTEEERAVRRERLRYEINELKNLLPAFEDSKPLGTRVTEFLSPHVGIRELEEQLRKI